MFKTLETEREGMRKEKGFSLIELLIVVAIILIIAAIAVPNLLRSRMAANESSAAAALRTIGTANVTYSTAYNVGFAGSLTALGPKAGVTPTSADSDMLDSVLGSSTQPAIKSGYTFSYVAGPTGATPTSTAPNTTFETVANPVGRGSSGQSNFCVSQSNVVTKDATATMNWTASAANGCAGNGAPI